MILNILMDTLNKNYRALRKKLEYILKFLSCSKLQEILNHVTFIQPTDCKQDFLNTRNKVNSIDCHSRHF
jgi:hypothetical protein